MPEEKQTAWPDHYRYVDEIGPDGVIIACRRFVVVHETEHCYWIVSPNYEYVALEKRAEKRGRIYFHDIPS
ncbi:hypothetical protein NLK61_00575 [Pseudomonas fuscovaginae UPB0736]|uniref:hypothetical protein n=1 Tax=Pseudomonas asplenii TaxID=53407 RepID=UPI000287D246|nr:hypothetical protein [Pseudomonas fuscovaginae]UUQ65181.1 hypothetical protein NLK61_00575 [Pseudomonas fuscovaginae UPB0736]